MENGDDIIKEKREEYLRDIGETIGIRLKEQIIKELNHSIEWMEETLCAE